MLANLERYLGEGGNIKPDLVKLLKDGLAGIVGGLGEAGNGAVSGMKLVVRPGETSHGMVGGQNIAEPSINHVYSSI